ncbi:uncharacterized protein [Physcomitrium patens]|uniref:uncharacterized protein n=1 Tax=Physcomitrium patens TaxID=3218 RepID=UPI003CCCA4E1
MPGTAMPRRLDCMQKTPNSPTRGHASGNSLSVSSRVSALYICPTAGLWTRLRGIAFHTRETRRAQVGRFDDDDDSRTFWWTTNLTTAAYPFQLLLTRGWLDDLVPFPAAIGAPS